MSTSDKSPSRKQSGPAPEFVNVSGAHVRDLARGIMALLETPFAEGLQADVAAHVLVVTAVDLWRANYGDEQVAQVFKRAVDRRLSKPLDWWGAQPAPTNSGPASEDAHG